MDILLIILGILCLLTGLAGCFLPVLPGPPVSYAGLLLLHFTDKIHFSTTHLILWALLVIIVQVLDYVTPMLGTKYSGGGKWGNWGCVIGTIAGLFVFPPWGVLIGPFAGAVIGELLGERSLVEAFKAGGRGFCWISVQCGGESVGLWLFYLLLCCGSILINLISAFFVTFVD